MHKHTLSEMDTACADGSCPLCLGEQIDKLRTRITKLEAVAEAAKKVAGRYREICGPYSPKILDDLEAALKAVETAS